MMQVNIRSIDEAIVIGAALSLSSSAFVLQVGSLALAFNDLVAHCSFMLLLTCFSCQILSERGELATRFGSATLGILLLQVFN